MKFKSIITFATVNLLLIIGYLIALNGCKEGSILRKDRITVRGSDTMVNLTQRWVENYLNKNPEVSIQVSGGGSGTGIAALLNGTADIANISRELKESEKKKAASLNINPVQFKVALDGIAVIVHPSNKVDTLTAEQIKNIFSGKIKNWKYLGGEDKQIVIYSRENSSGTYELFKQKILGRDEEDRQIDFSPSTQVLQGTAALGEAIAKDSKGIGYGGVGYFAKRNDLKVLYIRKNDSSEAVSPIENGRVNFEVIWNGKYPLSRYLYCYTNGKPKSAVADFLDFITSEEGQKAVVNMEYIPLASFN